MAKKKTASTRAKKSTRRSDLKGQKVMPEADSSDHEIEDGITELVNAKDAFSAAGKAMGDADQELQSLFRRKGVTEYFSRSQGVGFELTEVAAQSKLKKIKAPKAEDE